MNLTVEHLGLPAQSPTALKEWYVTRLGARVVYDSQQTPPAYFLALPGGMLLEVYAGESALPEVANNRLCGWRHLALRVESIEQAQRELAALGVQFEEPVKPAGGGGRVLFFRDPEGNLLHLVERPKEWRLNNQ
jgi:catechol 2,3-dioxygenase-like lactoylglutathione lyase family enzyme